MVKVEHFTMEFHLETTPKLLFTLISTPEGLTRWFAPTIKTGDDTLVFQWPSNEQMVRVMHAKESEYVIFQWLEDYHKGYDLQMRIETESDASGVTLVISDFAEVGDVDFSKRIWESLVGKLQKIFHN